MARQANVYGIALFDYDGVIVISAEIKARGFEQCFPRESAEALEAIGAYVRMHGGQSRFAKFRHIHSDILKRPLFAGELDWLCDRYRDYVLTEVERAPFVPGAVELIEAIHHTTDCYVVSGAPQDELRQLTRLRGIDHRFKDVLGSPAPKLELTMAVIGRYVGRRDEMVFVGDSLTDYEVATAAGIAFLGVATPGEPGGLPDWVEVVPDLMAYRSRFTPQA